MLISYLYPKIKGNIDILGITSNSKNVKKGFIFVAIKGHTNDGVCFIKEAIDKGALFIVTSARLIRGRNIIHVKNPKDELIRLLQSFYSYNNSLYTVGVTGTDGKTTTATILSHIFNEGNLSSYIGTNGISYLDRHYNTINTTPDPETLYQAYNIFKNRSIKSIVMEVSSEGILDGRIKGFSFNGAIYTNLSHEHLNAHKTMQAYFNCKARLFKAIDDKGLIIANCDDDYFPQITNHTAALIISYGLNNGLYQAVNIHITEDGSQFSLRYKGKILYNFKTYLFGSYNIYNCLAAIAYSYEIGFPLQTIDKAISKIKCIDGRFIKYRFDNRLAIIDYAHTPNGLFNLLINIKAFVKGRIILVIGSQGLKDDSKRPLIGSVAARMSDIVIFTSEDPKTENIFNIFYSLTKNLENVDYYLTLSRFDGIKLAYNISKPKDTIVIVGKGNEQYEDIQGYKLHHNDLNVLKTIINNDLFNHS